MSKLNSTSHLGWDVFETSEKCLIKRRQNSKTKWRCLEDVLRRLKGGRKVGCELMRHRILGNFYDTHWDTENLSVVRNWHPGNLGISAPVETAVEMLLVATSKFAFLTVRWHRATRKHLFLFSQCNRSGPRKPKKYKCQYKSQLSSAFIYLS